MEGSEHEKEKIERLRRAMYSRSLSGMLKEHERHALAESKDLTEEDFLKRLEREKEEQEEQLKTMVVAPRTIGFARATLWWLLGIAILFFVGAVSFFAYYFLIGDGAFASSRNIGISVTGPPQIEGGSPTQLQIAVVNHNKVPLEVADIVITYPPGTRSTFDALTDMPNYRKSLGFIGPGETRRGTVSAIFAGGEGGSVDVHIELEYQIQGSNAIFTTSTDYNATLSSSPLALAVEGNREAISGQPIEMTVNVTSNASDRVADVLMQAQYPFGFKFVSSIPAPAKPGLWALGDLQPGQKIPVLIRGTLTGEQGDDRIFRFSAGTRRSTSASAIETSMAEYILPVAISKPFLGLSVSVGGSQKSGTDATTDGSFTSSSESGSNIVVAPGDDVTVAIAWQNNLPTPINDVVIAARLSGMHIDGSTVRTEDGFYRSTDNILLWDKTTSNGTLANLPAGSKGVVSFTFKIPDNDALTGIVDPKLSISINAAGKRVSEKGVPESLQSSITKNVAVASNVGLVARGLYYANPFGSVGPMPPKAERETTYALALVVTNSTNKISGAYITAQLPPYVRYIGIFRPASADLKFKDADGSITWNIGDLEPGVGLNGTAPRTVIIAVGLTPSASQIGQEPSLLRNIQLWGIDTFAAENKLKSNPSAQIVPEILKEARDITTNIQGDPGFSSANSTVVK